MSGENELCAAAALSSGKQDVLSIPSELDAIACCTANTANWHPAVRKWLIDSTADVYGERLCGLLHSQPVKFLLRNFTFLIYWFIECDLLLVGKMFVHSLLSKTTHGLFLIMFLRYPDTFARNPSFWPWISNQHGDEIRTTDGQVLDLLISTLAPKCS